MSLKFEHECEDCTRDPEQCYCNRCFQEIKNRVYDEGFEDGKKEGRKEAEAEKTE